MKIRIEDQEYNIEYTLRGFFVYEQITGTHFVADKLVNEYTLLYAMLIAGNKSFRMAFDEFIEACDKEPGIYIAFRNWFVETLKQKALLITESSEPEEGVKKKD